MSNAAYLRSLERQITERQKVKEREAQEELAMDLSLIRRNNNGQMGIANPVSYLSCCKVGSYCVLMG